MKDSLVSINEDIDPVMIALILTVVTVGISDSIGRRTVFSGCSSKSVLKMSNFFPLYKDFEVSR